VEDPDGLDEQQKRDLEEAISVTDGVLISLPRNKATLSAMITHCMVLGRDLDMPPRHVLMMFVEALRLTTEQVGQA
jgi:hypothetical protein